MEVRLKELILNRKLDKAFSHTRIKFSLGREEAFAALEARRNWAELTFAKTSGTVTGDRNWPIADWRVHSNNPRNNCGTLWVQFPSRSKVANVL